MSNQFNGCLPRVGGQMRSSVARVLIGVHPFAHQCAPMFVVVHENERGMPMRCFGLASIVCRAEGAISTAMIYEFH